MSDVKILVCGDVCGNFRLLFSKVNAILKKKSGFEYLLCVGTFFGSHSDELDDLKAGKIKVPLSTYILGANEESHEKLYKFLDSVPNITYLGKKGCLTAISGLKIAYLSGLELPESGNISSRHDKNNGIYFSKKDVDEMISSFESETVIDILLTSQWPKGVTKYAISLEKNVSCPEKFSSSLISGLAKILKPRYHFCGLAGIHYERVPYRNHVVLQETPVHVTRFFALAPVNNAEKQKWLYAFNICPARCLNLKQLTENPGPATECPYEYGVYESSNKSNDQFFYDTASPNHFKKRSRGDNNRNQSKKMSIDSSSCWFCLTNSDVEKQLIISIGNHCYITLPKGVLVPEHVLIVPVKHAISSVELPDDVSEEVDKFKKSLANYFHDQNKDVVFFERNYSSPHLQIQAVPIPKDLKIEIQDALFREAKEYDLEFNELPNFSQIQQVVHPKKPYFYFEIMIDKKIEAKYMHVINSKFPLQFGRSVLACPQVLNITHRIDWRSCQDSKPVEKEMAENMRKTFEQYDFTQL